jgi:putative ABC transport system permease protein
MFVAWRDLRFARGRFALIISVVVLITLLIGMLSGLMTGLRGQNISAIEALTADRIVFSAPASGSSLSYSDSVISERQLNDWQQAGDGASVQPIGIAMGKVSANDAQLSVALFGVQPDFALTAGEVAPQDAGTLVLSREAGEKLHVSSGDTVTINGEKYTVATITGDAWYSHTPVIWMQLTDWQEYSAATGSPNAVATVLAVNGIDSTTADALNEQAGTVTTSVKDSFNAIGGYQSENGSLLMMLGMLLLISGLVIGAFFTVWTIQRTSDIAILKALGASTRALVLDALGQAMVVLAIGVGIGIGLTVILGQLAERAVPFVTSLSTTVLPGALMIALGLAGAIFALRSIVTSNPLTAIGSR